MSMKIIELVIDDTVDGIGVEAVSVVNSPAIEVDFVALSKVKVEFKEVDTEKRVLLGPALIPNKQIYREDAEVGKYYIWFSKDTIRKASELFFKNHNQDKATFEHLEPVQGMTVVESWIVDDSATDKSALYGFSMPKGTWMMSMKVENEEVWNMVKGGTVKGFSIEGYFADKLSMKKHTPKDAVINILKEWVRNAPSRK
jgi:hypothetical protein